MIYANKIINKKLVRSDSREKFCYKKYDQKYYFS